MSNKDYISKQAVLSKLWRRKHHEDYEDDVFDEILEIEKDIKSLPGADVEEVRHGRLEHIADFGNGNCFGYCSVCRAEHKADNPTALQFAYRRCRWCGAKLDKEREG